MSTQHLRHLLVTIAVILIVSGSSWEGSRWMAMKNFKRSRVKHSPSLLRSARTAVNISMDCLIVARNPYIPELLKVFYFQIHTINFQLLKAR